jgi:hypothetical protein
VLARRIQGSAFFTFRQSDVVLVGVQDPVILHSEDDNMQHIVIIGRFRRNDADVGDPAKPLDINAKNCASRHFIAISKPCRESLSDQPSTLPEEIRDQNHATILTYFPCRRRGSGPTMDRQET